MAIKLIGEQSWRQYSARHVISESFVFDSNGGSRKKNGDIIVVRDVFEKIIHCVDKYKTIGNTAMQLAPSTASAPWGIVSNLLEVCYC